MPHVQVTIAGRGYRMACGEGEEDHLVGLATRFDGKIAEMRAAFGEIGDMRLHVMAALTLADEAAEQGRRLEALADEIEALRRSAGAEADQDAAGERALAGTLVAVAERIERLARSLVDPPPRDDERDTAVD